MNCVVNKRTGTDLLCDECRESPQPITREELDRLIYKVQRATLSVRESETLIAEVKRLREVEAAARALLSKLDTVCADPSYQSIWESARVHGFTYEGPHCGDEQEALRKLLPGASE